MLLRYCHYRSSVGVFYTLLVLSSLSILFSSRHLLCNGDETAGQNTNICDDTDNTCLSANTSNAFMKRKKILSFGGNGFIGAETISRLLEIPSSERDDKYDGRKDHQEYEILLVSRGTWPNDSYQRIYPHVTSLYCDRDESIQESCPDVVAAVRDTEEFYAVIDFSGFDPEWIRDTVSLLQNTIVRVYVYISTDSVYEVSIPFVATSSVDNDYGKGQATLLNHYRLTREVDAVRPTDLKEQERLREFDTYGDDKLACEEELILQQQNDGFPWVALRLADVIGPRDTSPRWFLYQLWIKFYNDMTGGEKGGVPMYIPPFLIDQPLSVTYVEDAAWSVIRSIKGDIQTWNTAYNIASDEQMTLKKFLERMASLIIINTKNNDDVSHINKNSNSNNKIGANIVFSHDDGSHFYPSVYRGGIDVSKAKEVLGFVPTSIAEVFRKTVNWHEMAFNTMDEWRDEVVAELIEEHQLVSEEHIHSFLLAVGKNVQDEA